VSEFEQLAARSTQLWTQVVAFLREIDRTKDASMAT